MQKDSSGNLKSAPEVLLANVCYLARQMMNKPRSLMYTTAKRFGRYVAVCLDDVWQYSEKELNAATANSMMEGRELVKVGEFCPVSYGKPGWW